MVPGTDMHQRIYKWPGNYAGVQGLSLETIRQAIARLSDEVTRRVKARRQAKILELIKTSVIETQEDLADALGRQGIPVTQATVSRDIKELQLNKVPVGDGRYRYALPDEIAPGTWDKRRRIFQESVLGVDFSGNIIVIRSLPGTAQGVAAAIDHLGWADILGSVAGDDTVMVVVKPVEDTPLTAERIKGLMR